MMFSMALCTKRKYCAALTNSLIFDPMCVCVDGELQNPPVPKDVMASLARMEKEVPVLSNF